MPVPLPPLRGPALLVADGGASAHTTDHTTEALELAVRLGATGIALDVWRPDPDVVVAARRRMLDARRWVRRRTAAQRGATDSAGRGLPLAEIFAATPRGIALGLSVADDESFDAVVACAAEFDRLDDLWCRHPDVEVLRAWRNSAAEAVHFVLTLHAAPPAGGLERRVAELRAAGIDALEMNAPSWTSGHVALVHRFGRLGWAKDAEHPPVISRLLLSGLDAVIGRNVEHLTDAAGA